MATEIIDPTTLGYLVEKFGFPIGVAILLLCVVTTLTMLVVKSTIERQKMMDKFYFRRLDEKFCEYSNTLTDILLEMQKVSLKLSECKDAIDDLESKSIAYIFRENSINRIKDNSAIDVTTQIVKQ